MEENKLRKAFEQMLGNIDAKIFLKASPLESGERSKLDKVLSEDMYYECLYAHSNEAEKLIKEIKDKIISEDTHNFILSGYKGCGKSTFVRYFLRNINARSLIINFDDYWEPREGIYHNIAMFIYRKILRDFFPNDGDEPCRISDKYIELFHDSMNGEIIEEQVDLHNFFTYFTHKLSFVRYEWITHRNEKDSKQKLRDHVKAHIETGSISNLMMLLVFWDVAERIIKHGKPLCCIVFENLDVIHNTEDIPQLVKSIIAFRNNIDRICTSIYYQGQRICDPSQDYILMLVMRETTKAEFTNSIEHFSDGKIRFQHFMTISRVYDLYDIISKRYDYLEGLKSQFANNTPFCEMLKAIKNIKSILGNPGTRKRIFSVFNNDYRTCVEALDRLGFSDPKILGALNRFDKMPEDENWPLFGSRSLIFRHIFNSFVNDVFIKMVRKYEYSVSEKGKVGSINLDRMILLYLNNCQDILVDDEFAEKDYVPLNVLYLEILKFCKKPETIVDAMWNMYDLQKTEMWNHLVTFDDIKTITISELQSEMDAVIQKKENFNFARIKITLAGQAYLNYILPHFEYYASRSESGKGYSLFCLTAKDLCNIRKIEKAIKNVRKEVSDCCKRLHLFFEDVFDKIDEFKGEDFLRTKFACIKVSESKKSVSRMYHCEKIIYSHVNYLDSFRFFVFHIFDEVVQNGGFGAEVDITDFIHKLTGFNNCIKHILPKELLDTDNTQIFLKPKRIEQIVELHKSSGEIVECSVSIEIIIKALKVCYNRSIIDFIKSYMQMFGFYGGSQCTRHSNGTTNIHAAFDACITYNIVPSNYEDFGTHIRFESGEEIIANRKRAARKERQQIRLKENVKRKKQMDL